MASSDLLSEARLTPASTIFLTQAGPRRSKLTSSPPSDTNTWADDEDQPGCWMIRM